MRVRERERESERVREKAREIWKGKERERGRERKREMRWGREYGVWLSILTSSSSLAPAVLILLMLNSDAKLRLLFIVK